MGFAQAQVKDFTASANTFSVALSKAEKLNNKLLIMQSLEGLGSAFYHLKQYSKSQIYFEKALTLISTNNEQDSGLAKERLMEKISVVQMQRTKESGGLTSTGTDEDYLERVTEYFSNIADSSNNSSSANISVFSSPGTQKDLITSSNGGVGFGNGVKEGCLALGRSAKDIYTVRNGEIHQTTGDTPTITRRRTRKHEQNSSSSFCIVL